MVAEIIFICIACNHADTVCGGFCVSKAALTGCSVVWLARLIWDQEVAGSNPVTPIFLFNRYL